MKKKEIKLGLIFKSAIMYVDEEGNRFICEAAIRNLLEFHIQKDWHIKSPHHIKLEASSRKFKGSTKVKFSKAAGFKNFQASYMTYTGVNIYRYIIVFMEFEKIDQRCTRYVKITAL